jgi:polyisoprenoid-binding protein YceI
MNKLTLVLAALCISIIAFPQTWSLDKGHSKIGFTVDHHMISEVDGYFRKFNATLTSVKDDFSDAVFELTAETSSINSENEMRDKDLISPDFFDDEKFPALTFKSTSFKKEADKKYVLTGDLTIKGITKSITMDVILMGPLPHPRTKKPAVGITATCKINRKDFSIGPNLPEVMVSDEVELRATGEFNKN